MDDPKIPHDGTSQPGRESRAVGTELRKVLPHADMDKAKTVVFFTAAAGPVKRPHGLGRKVSGWIPTRIVGAGLDLNEDRAASNDKFLTLVFAAAGAAEVLVW